MEEILLIEGEELDLQCSSNGVPAPNVLWTKNEVSIFPSDHIKVYFFIFLCKIYKN